MLPFRILHDARNWFGLLRADGSMEIDFDPYYFCLMAGIAAGRKRTASGEETAELVNYFPGRYRARAKLLIGLFLQQELADLGIRIEERRVVHAQVADLVRQDSPNYLTEKGVKEFNRYAHGGFDVLLDWFDDKPRSIEYFVRAYKQALDGFQLAQGNR